MRPLIYDNRKDEDGDYDDEMFSRFYSFSAGVAAATRSHIFLLSCRVVHTFFPSSLVHLAFF